MKIKNNKKLRLIVLSSIFVIVLISGIIFTTNKNNLSASLINADSFNAQKSTNIILKDKNEKKEFTTEKDALEQALEEQNIILSENDQISPDLDTNLHNYTLLFVELDRRYAITIIDNNKEKEIITNKNKVKNILDEQKIKIGKKDKITPNLEDQLSNNDTITIIRANSITISVDNQIRTIKTRFKKTNKILSAAGIKLNQDDYTIPSKNSKIQDNGKIEIIRVTNKTETVQEEVVYEAIIKYSDNLYEDEKEITQNGQNGIFEKTYEIILENDQEINKKLISKKTTLKPQNKIIVQGTKKRPTGQVISGGQATYYYGPTIAACNLFPRGTKVRVTNANNGKSIEVVIDDTGGFSWPITIDLRYDHFKKIAGPGDDGLMNVTLEEML